MIRQLSAKSQDKTAIGSSNPESVIIVMMHDNKAWIVMWNRFNKARKGTWCGQLASDMAATISIFLLLGSIHPSWNRRGIYVSRSCWDYMVKRVEMSSFLNVRIPKGYSICYVRGSDMEKTRHFHMFHHIISTWPTNINTMSVPK